MDNGDENFELRESHDDGRVVLAVAGELDIAASEQLQARLDALRGAGTAVFLDLSPLEFIDSSGLACITHAVHASRDGGWSLTIGHELQPQVQRLLELVSGEQLFWPNGY